MKNSPKDPRSAKFSRAPQTSSRAPRAPHAPRPSQASQTTSHPQRGSQASRAGKDSYAGKASKGGGKPFRPRKDFKSDKDFKRDRPAGTEEDFKPDRPFKSGKAFKPGSAFKSGSAQRSDKAFQTAKPAQPPKRHSPASSFGSGKPAPAGRLRRYGPSPASSSPASFPAPRSPRPPAPPAAAAAPGASTTQSGPARWRLQRWMAQCGAGSRRACEEIILQGRVTLNGVKVTVLGTTIDPDADEVRLDGERLRLPGTARRTKRPAPKATFAPPSDTPADASCGGLSPTAESAEGAASEPAAAVPAAVEPAAAPPAAGPAPLVWMIYKPAGVTCTLRDPHARQTLPDAFPRLFQHAKGRRIIPVGRLDHDSEGLLLLTNDGNLANHLTHPRYHVEKEYEALVAGEIRVAILHQWKDGIEIPALDEEKSRSGRILVRAQAWPLGRYKTPERLSRGRYKIILEEGRKRQIRRMIEAAGARVIRLRRVRIGPIRLGNLKPGEARLLELPEVEALVHSASLGG